MLEQTKRDLQTVLKMVDSGHRNSLQYGITLLKRLDCNREVSSNMCMDLPDCTELTTCNNMNVCGVFK